MYLLDSNIVSNLRKPRPHPKLVAWLADTPGDALHLPACVITEIRIGIERARAGDPIKAAEIDQWLQSLRAMHRVVAMDAHIADLWGRLLASSLKGTDSMDLLIAATAIATGFTIVTNNVKDFQRIHRVFPLPEIFDPLPH